MLPVAETYTTSSSKCLIVINKSLSPVHCMCEIGNLGQSPFSKGLYIKRQLAVVIYFFGGAIIIECLLYSSLEHFVSHLNRMLTDKGQVVFAIRHEYYGM